MSKPPRLTLYARVDTPDSIALATTSSWAPSSPWPPADAPSLPSSSSRGSPGSSRSVFLLPSKAADTFVSSASEAPARRSRGCASPSTRASSEQARCQASGSFRPPSRTAAPAVVSPAMSGGSVAPTETALSGSPPPSWSSQRPSHPEGTGPDGDAVCQIAIERKWLWSGFGYDTPRTTASRLSSQSFFRPFIPGLRPSPSPSGSTSSSSYARSPRRSR
ncbi:hypothetical protein [Streptomyces sp. col6]|uniref:hypothetical protein n=1 Tax=Streptomyces sp. col6 TaxID=2478958 RepID=UPI001CD04877|nr:hypothetical protein [Streptomyces sp. col6]